MRFCQFTCLIEVIFVFLAITIIRADPPGHKIGSKDYTTALTDFESSNLPRHICYQIGAVALRS